MGYVEDLATRTFTDIYDKDDPDPHAWRRAWTVYEQEHSGPILTRALWGPSGMPW